MHHKNKLRSIAALWLLLVNVAWALPQDRFEVAYIKAKSSVYNYKTGKDVYEGDVQVDQGTSHIRADRLITKRNKAHQITEAIAYGLHQQALFWTTTDKDKPDVHANADIIKFYPLTGNITLIKKARIKQAENTFTGELIFYSKRAQTITVPQSQHAQAVIVYNPDK